MGTVLIFHCYQEDEVSKYAQLVTDPSTMGIGKWVMAPVPKRRDTSALGSKMALSTVLPKSEVKSDINTGSQWIRIPYKELC